MSTLGYAVRHQEAGVLYEHVFTSVPTAVQMEELLEFLTRRHGPLMLVSRPSEHVDPNTKWVTLVEVKLYAAGEPVELPQPKVGHVLESRPPQARGVATVS